MIQQGHKYAFRDETQVIALEEQWPGIWRVKEFILDQFLTVEHLVCDDALHPLPMKYFHGQIPK
jgi:hypothetical protein